MSESAAVDDAALGSEDVPSRRRFLSRVAGLGMTGFAGLTGRVASAQPSLETTRVRFVRSPAICMAPQYLAEEILRLDGFTDVQYLPLGSRYVPDVVADGRADFSMWDAPGLLPALDMGNSLIVLAGLHSGCYEIVCHERVRAIRDLKGKTVAVQYAAAGARLFLSSILAYVGIDPTREVEWVYGENMGDAMDLFIDRKADAFMGFAPEPQELRARKIGHVILNTSTDRPWSQYFCCMVIANRAFATRHPVATRRILRAMLIASDICAADPTKAARYLADHGYERRFGIGLETMENLSYLRWREMNPEDSLRFHALRLHEVGMIRTPPHKLIAQGTDWRFLNELKRELKA